MGYKVYIRDVKLSNTAHSLALILHEAEKHGHLWGSPICKFKYRKFHVTLEYTTPAAVASLIAHQAQLPFLYYKMSPIYYSQIRPGSLLQVR